MNDYFYALSHSNFETNTREPVEAIVDRECARGCDDDTLLSAEGDTYEDGCDFD